MSTQADYGIRESWANDHWHVVACLFAALLALILGIGAAVAGEWVETLLLTLSMLAAFAVMLQPVPPARKRAKD